MVDVVICFASADAAIADRLAEAVARNGYSLWSEEAMARAGTGPASIAERVADAKAAIVIWSESAAASDWVKAEANFARGQHKLIQASADDRPPPLPFNRAEVASLSNWRGEESHPGWRSIEDRLEALLGRAPAAAAAARGSVLPSGARRGAAPSPPRSSAPPRKRRRGLVAVLAIALLALAAIGSFLWMRSQGPISVQQRTAAAPEPRRTRSRPPAEAMAVTPPPIVAPPPADAAAPESTYQDPGAVSEPTPAAAAPEPRAAGPRINRRNSENMRRFCARAGRGTPQCRAFGRMLRNQRR